MSTFLVMTILGEDRPGLVEALARTIAEHEGNWLESRMARLAGKFAGILRVEVPELRADPLVRALRDLEAAGLQVIAQAGQAGERRARPLKLELVGADHPGIVRDLSRALARAGINVERLETECRPAPMSGEVLFCASAWLHLPPGASAERLRRELEELGHDLMVDVVLGDAAEAG